jgi:hypothetical protein
MEERRRDDAASGRNTYRHSLISRTRRQTSKIIVVELCRLVPRGCPQLVFDRGGDDVVVVPCIDAVQILRVESQQSAWIATPDRLRAAV